MGRKSTRSNKNIYQLSREELGLTREKASEQSDYLISADKIEKIESNKILPAPNEVITLSRCYKKPELCNYYCSHECPIGEKYVPEITATEFSQIVLELLANLNSLQHDKDRLIEISADGRITENEYPDFIAIRDKLEKISISVESMQLWLEKKIAEGQIDESVLLPANEAQDALTESK